MWKRYWISKGIPGRKGLIFKENKAKLSLVVTGNIVSKKKVNF